MPITKRADIYYPLGVLDVGDSFFIPAVAVKGPMGQLRKMAEELKITISYRSGVDTATGLYGIRVVRTA